ncbi:hypothetical protein AMAG_00548 [Allomyces macrogynus ATCC 38327]|uniref:Mitochondrial carrier n=1 Tax=Allomyces macrogynus (strain ATCC 38327) TaxID=578462 RepID=A0A0L0RX04_ALLM3|nr:hypothetical protein AMAG_00548 [Allomyces macrogynus ATCC 38327]|eukprot:KNE54581.1 hypothetical protein AMAG_00548 [Allomyces macrogynus ATCC 38327]
MSTASAPAFTTANAHSSDQLAPAPTPVKRSNGPTLHGFVCGIASGTTKLVVGHPFDTVKVRLQIEGLQGRFKGPIDCLAKTLRREGIRGLYKGATPPLLGWALMDSIQLGTLTNLRRCLQGDDPSVPLSIPGHALAGLGAGIVVSFVAAPVELLKAQMQVQYGDRETTRYSSPIACAKHIARVHPWGLVGLWSALPATLLFRSYFWLLWGSYEVYTQKLTAFGVNAAWVPFLAGGLAANSFWALSFPADVIKNRMMAQPQPINETSRYPTIVKTAKAIYATDGMRGFFRGFWTCQLRSFPTNGAALIVFEFLSKRLEHVL